MLIALENFGKGEVESPLIYMDDISDHLDLSEILSPNYLVRQVIRVLLIIIFKDFYITHVYDMI